MHLSEGWAPSDCVLCNAVHGLAHPLPSAPHVITLPHRAGRACCLLSLSLPIHLDSPLVSRSHLLRPRPATDPQQNHCARDVIPRPLRTQPICAAAVPRCPLQSIRGTAATCAWRLHGRDGCSGVWRLRWSQQGGGCEARQWWVRQRRRYAPTDGGEVSLPHIDI